MAFNPDSALVTDLDTAFDAVPTDGPDGPVLWATVKIEYVLSGLIPVVTIRVPVPYDPDEPEDRRRGKALRCARQLIDHACQVAGSLPAEPNRPKPSKLVEDCACRAGWRGKGVGPDRTDHTPPTAVESGLNLLDC